MNMEFEQIKDLIANYKNQVEIVEVMRELAYSLKLEDLAKLFGEYKKYCKGQCDWDKVGLTESDLTIYVLP
jgi:glutaredoxin-related protein